MKKTLKIQWEKTYAFRTDRFVEWCNDNPDKRAKLFSDSTQDAREEGRTKAQLSSGKKNLYFELAKYIFEDEPEVAEEWKVKSQPFVAATQRRHSA